MTGKQHDKYTWLTMPVILAGGFYFVPTMAGFIAAAHVFGGLYLSPDLDTYSNPYKRWSVWKLNYWYFYKQLIPHRSFISHSPIFGTVGRVVYLFGPWIWYFNLTDWLIEHWQTIGYLLIGLETGALTHLMCDMIGDVTKGKSK